MVSSAPAAMPVSQKPRQGALGGMAKRTRIIAREPAARAEVITHNMPPPLAILKRINCAPKPHPANIPSRSAAGGVGMAFDPGLLAAGSWVIIQMAARPIASPTAVNGLGRSEERRVGKEGRSRAS